MSDFNEADIAESAAQRTIDRILDDLYLPASKKLSIQRVKLGERFKAYFKHNFERCSKIQTLDHSSGPKSITDIFVDLRLSSVSHDVSTSALFDKVTNCNRCIITGKGGSGKSVLFKYFFLRHFSEEKRKIPLLIELRRFDSSRHKSLMGLSESTLLLKGNLPTGVFKSLCDEGFFDFFFDGFDEIKRSDKATIEFELLDLARRYPKCGVAVSGRSNSRFPTWEAFESYHICDLNMEEIENVIGTTAYNSETKSRFVSELRTGSLSERRKILATPLLANLFIMTYASYGEMPKNLSGFYSRAFDTLASRHDATKEAFKRDLCLTPDGWRTLFGIFCLISYIDMNYKFDERELKAYVKKAVNYAESLEAFEAIESVSLSDLCEDLWEGLNVLVRDYGSFQFIHRSFQEYFAAECVSRTINSKVRELLGVFADRDTDSSFLMSFEINEERVTDTFLAPGLHDMKQALGGLQENLSKSIFLLLDPKMIVSNYAKDYGSNAEYIVFQNLGALDFLKAAASIANLDEDFGFWVSQLTTLCERMVPVFPHNKIDPLGTTYEVQWNQQGEVELHFENDLTDSAFEMKLLTHLQDRSDAMFDSLCKNERMLFSNLISEIDEIIRRREHRRVSVDDLLGLRPS